MTTTILPPYLSQAIDRLEEAVNAIGDTYGLVATGPDEGHDEARNARAVLKEFYKCQ